MKLLFLNSNYYHGNKGTVACFVSFMNQFKQIKKYEIIENNSNRTIIAVQLKWYYLFFGFILLNRIEKNLNYHFSPIAHHIYIKSW